MVQHRDERRETRSAPRHALRGLLVLLAVLGGLAGPARARFGRLAKRLQHLNQLGDVLAINGTDSQNIKVHRFGSGMSLVIFDDRFAVDAEVAVRVDCGSVDELKGEGKWPAGTARLVEQGLLINMALERDRVAKEVTSSTKKEKTEFAFRFSAEKFAEGFRRVTKQLFDFQADSRIKFAFRKIREQ